MGSVIQHEGGAKPKPQRGSGLAERRSRRLARKGGLRAKVKGRRDRHEARVKKQVRAECDVRDGYCLVLTRIGLDECKGRSEWAHFAGHRRSQTRGMAPERRHDSRFSGKLCQFHHQQEESGKYGVVYRTVEYANGPIFWEKRQSKVA